MTSTRRRSKFEARALESSLAVTGALDRVALFLETLRDKCGGLLLVLDQQNAHYGKV
jgi:hypothetical protein